MQYLIKRIHQLLGAGFIPYYPGYTFSSASFWLLCLQFCSLLLGFLLNYVFIKFAPVAEYGKYVYFNNMLLLLSQLCLFGANILIVKMGSVYVNSGKIAYYKGLYFYSISIAFILSLICSVICVWFVPLFQNHLGWHGLSLFLLVFVALLLLTFTHINQAALQGLNNPLFSQLPEKLARPALLFVGIIILYQLRKRIHLPQMVFVQLSAIGLSSFCSYAFLRTISIKKNYTTRPRFESGEWVKAASGFFILTFLSIVNSRIDIVLLGQLGSNDALGIYNIVLKLSELISFVLTAINFLVAPQMAALYAQKRLPELQQLLTSSARVILMASLPLLLLLIGFRTPLLSFFQMSNGDANLAFMILCCGQVINLLMGSVGVLLLMSGHQRYALLSQGASILINISLNYALTPELGFVGTAIATASGLASWNFLMYFFVRKKLKLRTTALGNL